MASVVGHAGDVCKPTVLEKLDFRTKKEVLAGESRRYSRMLSSQRFGRVRPAYSGWRLSMCTIKHEYN